MTEINLVNRAKKSTKKQFRGKPDRIVITRQHVDLAIAWARDEVSVAQVNMVLNGTTNGGGKVGYQLAKYLKEAVRKGILKYD